MRTNLGKEGMHYLTKHKKEVVYLILIYASAIIPSFLGFLSMLKANQSLGMLLSVLIIPSISASLFAEYSYSNLGYRYSVAHSIYSFLLISLTLINLVTFGFHILPILYVYGLLVGTILILLSGIYFLRNDSCSCAKDCEV